jgi:GWxTD domain-containing protein
MRIPGIRNRSLLVLLSLFLSVQLLPAQDQDQRRTAKRQETPLRVVASFPYHKWLDEDVRWIITDQERSDFLNLTTDDQRDKFVEAFWESRNPTPGARENTFKEEHYQRIAYTNQHFASRVPGYKTDRGHYHIVYGPPDSVERNLRSPRPSEVWHYANVYGVGKDVVLRFVDTCQSGDYRLMENHSGTPVEGPH